MSGAVSITIRPGDRRRLLRTLRGAERPDLRDLHERIGRSVEPLIALQFVRQRDPYGVPWAPLAAATRTERRVGRDKRGRRRRAKILRDTGRLFGSTGFSASRDFVDVGVGDAKGIFHQEGTRHIPQRAFLPYDRSRGIDGFPQNWVDKVRVAVNGWAKAIGFDIT